MKLKLLLVALMTGGLFITTIAQTVTLYRDCNYRGISQKLTIGTHELSQTNIGNRQLSSLRVPNGLKVVLYSSSGAKGDLVNISSDITCLTDIGFNDKASSIVVERDRGNNNFPGRGNAVTLFEECNFRGNSRALEAGRHDVADLGIRNDRLSSFQLSNGYSITVYENSGYSGRSTTFRSSENCLSYTWNNKVSSIYVFRDRGNNNNNGFAAATLYESCNFTGNGNTLGPGYHDVADLGIRNDRLSSFQLANGFSITLFENSGYSGKSYTYNNSENCLTYTWNNKVSSVHIFRNGGGYNNGYNPGNNNTNNGGGVTVYRDCNYRGTSKTLTEGSYNAYQLGIGNDKLSSFRISPGYRITIFENSNYSGNSASYNNDVSCLSSYWNDKTSSIRIDRIGNNYGYDNNYNNNYYNNNNNNNPDNAVIIYSQENFGGRSAVLRPGSIAYLPDVGFPDNAISSLQLPPGWKVVLYDQPNFRGSSYNVLRTKDKFLLSGWSNKASSLIIYTSGGLK